MNYGNHDYDGGDQSESMTMEAFNQQMGMQLETLKQGPSIPDCQPPLTDSLDNNNHSEKFIQDSIQVTIEKDHEESPHVVQDSSQMPADK